MLTLNTPVEKINKIGKVTAGKLKKLDIKIAQDLIEHYPFRYDDYSQICKISELRDGERASVQGTIQFIQNKRSPRKRMMITEGLISDGSDQLRVVWFNQPFIGRNLHTGDKVSLAGLAQVELYGMQMTSPEYEKIYGFGATHTQGLVPVYHTTANLTNKQLRFLIKSVISVASKIQDWLQDDIKKKYNLLDLGQAYYNIHFPKDQKNLDESRKRLGFDELFFVQLNAQVQKSEVGSQRSEKIRFFEKKTKDFVNSLPFTLTKAQKKAGWEILQDIQRDKPMARLLEGDVGSGKTVTAALAMLNAALNKKQSALLVPTEILANQHFETLCQLFKGTEVKIGLFTRTQRKINKKANNISSPLLSRGGGQGVVLLTNQTTPVPSLSKEGNEIKKAITLSKKEILELIKKGEVDIIIGTHAMIQENVEFKNLALAIIDEQHRFGVEQRKALRNKSGDRKTIPHLLSMTATPIPRSLALVVYGDLDLSIINEMPKGRQKIDTFLVPEQKRQDAYNFIKKQVADGRQVFVICPLISPSDKLGIKSVEEEYKKLDEHTFPDLKIAYLHGRMSAKEKDEIMQKFLANQIKVLVSTSVVEVGVDVPNATIMMIEGAERFGLAQLHQFRGRVGRSTHKSYCLLFTENLNANSRKRLQTLTKTNDGFKLAEADLKMRGPGEVFGTAQKGFPEFKIANLCDHELIKQTKEAAQEVVAGGIEKYPKILEKVKKGYEWLVG